LRSAQRSNRRNCSQESVRHRPNGPIDGRPAGFGLRTAWTLAQLLARMRRWSMSNGPMMSCLRSFRPPGTARSARTVNARIGRPVCQEPQRCTVECLVWQRSQNRVGRSAPRTSSARGPTRGSRLYISIDLTFGPNRRLGSLCHYLVMKALWIRDLCGKTPRTKRQFERVTCRRE